jgi:HAD superfamily hydrolase (TIGR01484 family)
MRYQVLACDYDGTIAHDGQVDDITVQALERLLATGRRLVLVTGRELPDLLAIFPRLDLFEWVVAENGALMYRTATREEHLLAPPPEQKFLNELNRRGVEPIAVGRCIVATREPHQKAVFEAIHDLGLELQVIFNKGAVMVLPAGITKATGLKAALKQMGLSAHNAAGVGDAENDHAFLRLCECAAAVANALPSVKETADVVTAGEEGAGVAELIGEMISTDLAGRESRLARHALVLGTRDGLAVTLPPYGPCVLIIGPSASGKSTVATGFLEGLAEQKYQFCVIDPEGDYDSFTGCVALGDPRRAPTVGEVLRLLDQPQTNVVVTLTGLAIAERPPFFLELLPALLRLRARLGRPHWLVVDEAHHLMPAAWEPPATLLPQALQSVLLITVHPDLLSDEVLGRVDTVLAVGKNAEGTVGEFANRLGVALPAEGKLDLAAGEVLLWQREQGAPVRIHVRTSQGEQRRHRRKYAEGALPPERSFYFHGPDNRLNLRAQNLMLFVQLAEGVDDETWQHHLSRGDYSRWFREGIKDETLAAEAERIEHLPHLKPAESRALIRAAIERDYTLPATATLPVQGAG